MPNAIGPTGLTTATQAELIDYYSTAFRSIYGTDINLEPDSPDGQMMMVWIQAVMDLQDLLTQIYNSFDPDNAIGNVLDQRVAINGIQRQAGTRTVTNVTITVSESLTLYGVDQAVNPPYTVADNEGNQWELLETINLAVADVYILAFQAAIPGAVLSVPNTITVPVSIVLGVTAINNPTTYTTLGLTEESDADLKIRRQKSVSLSSQGYLDGLLAALENISGVVSAFVYENTTGSTDSDGIPSHSIWVIVSGAVSAAAIANAIYTKRNAGCGMKGDETFTISQADGTNFVVRWDTVTPEDLFIKFTATSLDGVNPPNIAAIRAGLVTSFTPGVNGKVNVNELATLVQAIDSNCLVTSAGFSTASGGAYTSTLSPSSKDKQFTITSDNIIILPIILNPVAPDTVTDGDEIEFSALGGFGTYTFTIHTNVSGGTINGSTGVYTAGATPGTDVVRVTDGLGNFTDVNVTVA
jgi:uncharacterized phage protein gp47/JayE